MHRHNNLGIFFAVYTVNLDANHTLIQLLIGVRFCIFLHINRTRYPIGDLLFSSDTHFST